MEIMAFIDWLTLKDYDKAKADGRRRIVARYSRGNVLVQRGRYLDQADAADVVRRGDVAMDKLERAAAGR